MRKYSTPVPAANANTPPARPIVSTIGISDIAVGDTVRVQGTVTGTNVVATSIIDGIKLANPTARGGGIGSPSFDQKAAPLKAQVEAAVPGLWAKIVSFLSGLFGKKK